MDLTSIPLFQAMARRMAWLGERQQVLAQNVANADTPNYRPRDLKGPSFAELVGSPARSGQLALATTRDKHLAAAGSAAQFRSEVVPSEGVSPSGNGVSLEGEMIKVSSTASDFQMITSLYRRQINMLKTVLGHGG